MILWPTTTVGDAASDREVESGVTVSVVVAVDPGIVDPRLGVNTAASRTGELEAANDVWQVTAGLCGVTGSSTQFGIGAAPFSNVIVPEGGPEEEFATANSVTVWLVTSTEGDATSEVVVAPAVWVSVA